MKYAKVSRNKYLGTKLSWGAPGWPAHWSSPPHPEAFLSLPASPEADGHHICSSGSCLLFSQSSASSCVSHEILGWLKGVKQERREELISSSKAIMLIPPLYSNAYHFPATWSPAHCCFLYLQISGGRNALIQRGGSPGYGSSSSFPGVEGLLYWSLGALVRLRVLWYNNFSGQFVLGSLQAEKTEWESQLVQLTPRGQVDPWGFLFRHWDKSQTVLTPWQHLTGMLLLPHLWIGKGGQILMWLTVSLLGDSSVDWGIFQNQTGPKSIWGGCSFQGIRWVLVNDVYALCSV